ncbi:THAP domain-containing protein 5-like [Sabethes cyaneus]|uniref:THAP domain-containing protein 5-like n=1 Tax=Sabethes cyaneus TaxID=53552 RepID=UPI00237D4432|nr:THAP domain-containing protein 5-like [Sabethes cyaneus]
MASSNKPKKKAVGNCCSVVSCKNSSANTSHIRFYSFPAKPHMHEQKAKWIAAIRRLNSDGSAWMPTKHSRICSAHFENNTKSNHPLSPSFVPTIFPKLYMKNRLPVNSTERFIRLQKRTKSTVARCSLSDTTRKRVPEMSTEAEVGETISTQKRRAQDQCTQVDFLESEAVLDCNMFICTQVINGESRDVQTQISSVTGKKGFKLVKPASKSCGTDIIYKTKLVGPDQVNRP